eukprot:CAMPEP_0119539052 /NCGR_PEP_ID=MMETSP1344-20130328/51306_1 /TAXON_ID=236787 /ORGANISM="Florenciella parvula, Strain CCMP2471" /LENGTH=118 /DNA_ID=CAMNT_0007582203 /DNA_START=267 /DNA_END=623 /DNA_ORIENTATION=-
MDNQRIIDGYPTMTADGRRPGGTEHRDARVVPRLAAQGTWDPNLGGYGSHEVPRSVSTHLDPYQPIPFRSASFLFACAGLLAPAPARLARPCFAQPRPALPRPPSPGPAARRYRLRAW